MEEETESPPLEAVYAQYSLQQKFYCDFSDTREEMEHIYDTYRSYHSPYPHPNSPHYQWPPDIQHRYRQNNIHLTVNNNIWQQPRANPYAPSYSHQQRFHHSSNFHQSFHVPTPYPASYPHGYNLPIAFGESTEQGHSVVQSISSPPLPCQQSVSATMQSTIIPAISDSDQTSISPSVSLQSQVHTSIPPLLSLPTPSSAPISAASLQYQNSRSISSNVIDSNPNLSVINESKPTANFSIAQDNQLDSVCTSKNCKCQVKSRECGDRVCELNSKGDKPATKANVPAMNLHSLSDFCAEPSNKYPTSATTSTVGYGNSLLGKHPYPRRKAKKKRGRKKKNKKGIIPGAPTVIPPEKTSSTLRKCSDAIISKNSSPSTLSKNVSDSKPGATPRPTLSTSLLLRKALTDISSQKSTKYGSSTTASVYSQVSEKQSRLCDTVLPVQISAASTSSSGLSNKCSVLPLPTSVSTTQACTTSPCSVATVTSCHQLTDRTLPSTSSSSSVLSLPVKIDSSTTTMAVTPQAKISNLFSQKSLSQSPSSTNSITGSLNSSQISNTIVRHTLTEASVSSSTVAESSSKSNSESLAAVLSSHLTPTTSVVNSCNSSPSDDSFHTALARSPTNTNSSIGMPHESPGSVSSIEDEIVISSSSTALVAPKTFFPQRPTLASTTTVTVHDKPVATPQLSSLILRDDSEVKNLQPTHKTPICSPSALKRKGRVPVRRPVSEPRSETSSGKCLQTLSFSQLSTNQPFSFTPSFSYSSSAVSPSISETSMSMSNSSPCSTKSHQPLIVSIHTSSLVGVLTTEASTGQTLQTKDRNSSNIEPLSDDDLYCASNSLPGKKLPSMKQVHQQQYEMTDYHQNVEQEEGTLGQQMHVDPTTSKPILFDDTRDTPLWIRDGGSNSPMKGVVEQTCESKRLTGSFYGASPSSNPYNVSGARDESSRSDIGSTTKDASSGSEMVEKKSKTTSVLSSEDFKKSFNLASSSSYESRRKRRLNDSEGGKDNFSSPQSKRICQRNIMPYECGEEHIEVDLLPHNLGAQFKTEMETLTNVENEVLHTIMESQEELSKLRESELTIAAYADFILSDELSVKARIKKLTEELQMVLREKQELLQNHSSEMLLTTLKLLNEQEHKLQAKLLEVQQEMGEKQDMVVRATERLHNVKEHQEIEQSRIDMLSAEYQAILWGKWEALKLIRFSSPKHQIFVSKPSEETSSSTNNGPSNVVSSSAGTSHNTSVHFGDIYSKAKSQKSETASIPATLSLCDDSRERVLLSTKLQSSCKVNEKSTGKDLPTTVDLLPTFEPSRGTLEEGELITDEDTTLEEGELVTDDDTTNRNKSSSNIPQEITASNMGVRVLNPVSFAPHNGSVLSVKVLGDNLYTASSDSNIRVFNVHTGELLQTLLYHKRSVTCLELYENDGNNFLLSGSSDKCIYMFNTMNGKKVAEYVLGVRVMYMCISGDILYTGLRSGSVLVINLKKNTALGKHPCHSRDQSVSSLSVSGNLLFTAAFDLVLSTWEVTVSTSAGVEKVSFKHLKQLKLTNTVLAMKVVQEQQVMIPGIGDRLYSACGDGKLLCHCIRTWNELHCISHKEPVSSLEIVGKVLVLGGFDKTVRIFDLKTLELLQVYAGYPDKIFSLCVSKEMVYVGLMSGGVQATKLDLTEFYPCKWEKCHLRFGVLNHLRDHHLKEHIPDTSKNQRVTCKWKSCSQTVEVRLLLDHLKHHVAPSL